MEPLDEYFEKIKKEKPLLSELEVRSLLTNSEIKDYKKYWINIAASLIFLAISTYFVFQFSSNEISRTDDLIAYNDFRYSKLIHEISKQQENENIQLLISEEAKQNKIPIEKSAVLKLSKSRLQKLGFQISKDKIVYKANIEIGGYLSFELKGNERSMLVSDYTKEDVLSYNFYPMYLSDIEGKQTTRFRLKNESNNKHENVSQKINSLIPVLIDVPQGNQKVIFWFLPTKNLLDILEEDILMNDLVLNDKIQIKAKTYFNRIYPNPSKQFLSIDNNLLRGGSQIELLDINGKKVKEFRYEVAKLNISKTHKFNIEDIERGVYLVSIRKRNQPRSIRRLIISD